MKRILAGLFAATLATASVAQDESNTILVLDGSGSMWGQIEGIAKITIAQEVVAGILADFPADQGLGLTVYGHRERGNCADIETIVSPAPGTVPQIIEAVNGISPLGRTPMTDAVVAAAEALRYTENAATVILVSDGVETCNPDPCAAARLLEQAGIDFTAHVVGFDVDDPEALAQMQCIADETGGQFVTASNAAELDLAMTQMVMAAPEPEPEPALIEMTFTALIGDDARLIDTPILWTIDGNGESLVSDAVGNPLLYELPEGAYTATAYSVADEVSGTAQFIAIAGGTTAVEVLFEEQMPTARIIAPAEAPAGSTVQVGWAGPDADRDYVGVGAVGAEANKRWENLFYTRDGNPGELLMPTAPGDYVITYFLYDGRTPIGQAPITLTPVTGAITAPAEALVGADVAITWEGPDYRNDYIGIGRVGAEADKRWENFFYTRGENTQMLTMPTEPGDYEISYFFGQDRRILVSVPITLTEVAATIDAPAEATVGNTIAVAWTGPAYDNDYIGIGAAGATGSDRWDNFTYTREGSPLQLELPTAPGDYVISYFLNQDREILVSVPITLTPVTATIDAPTEATAGSEVAVAWTGPDYTNDYIGIGIAGAEGSDRWENFTYTRDGSPLQLEMPTAPGDYVISYFLNQDRAIIASVPITLTEAGATLDVPAEALAGSTISVGWTGPDYPNDYVGIGIAGASGSDRWQNFSYTADGNPAALLVPMTPGDYLVQYFLGQDREILASETISVTALKVEIDAPTEVVAGSTISVGFDGPAYVGDYIGIGPATSDGSDRWENFAYTEAGTPLDLLVPMGEGDYLIRYFSGQDRSVLQSVPITVTAVEAQLVAPPSAAAGSELLVGWDGPNYDGDYIGVGRAGADGSDRWDAFAYTETGNPVTIRLPDAPGDYVVQYFTRQDRVSIASLPLTIE